MQVDWKGLIVPLVPLGETVPSPCVSAAVVAKAVPSPCGPQVPALDEPKEPEPEVVHIPQPERVHLVSWFAQSSVTPSPRECIFSLESAVCENSHRRQHRQHRQSPY